MEAAAPLGKSSMMFNEQDLMMCSYNLTAVSSFVVPKLENISLKETENTSRLSGDPMPLTNVGCVPGRFGRLQQRNFRN